VIDIRELYRAANGTKEFIEFELESEEFEDLKVSNPISAKLELIRVEEGIALLVKELASTVDQECVRCQKAISVQVLIGEGEWLFYDQRPKDYDDENEFLFIDREEFEIDVVDPLRQEILLNLPVAPRCKGECASFDEEEKGVKALAALKDLWSEEGG